MKQETEVKKTEMEVRTILEIVEYFRDKATWTSHSLSNARATPVSPCSDWEVAEFIQKIQKGDPIAKLVISNIDWEESGGCKGDCLYPVTLIATKLPDGRYYLELSGYFDEYLKESPWGLKYHEPFHLEFIYS